MIRTQTHHINLDVYFDIILLRRRGKAYRAIAIETGVPKSTCWRICKCYEHYTADKGLIPFVDYDTNQIYFM